MKPPVFRFHYPVPGYDKYTATEDGEIFSWKSGEPIKISQWKQNTGYMMVKLNRDGYGVHTVIAKACIGLPEEKGMIVNHKDCNKLNNHVSNLEYLTQSQNKKHAIANKRGLKGRKVCQLDLDGKLIATYDSIIEASKASSADNRSISMMCCEKKGRKSVGGYLWCYAENLNECKAKGRDERNKHHVIQYTLDGKFVKKYEDLKDAGKAVNSSASNIANVCRGIQKTAKGFIWKYEEVKREKKVNPIEEEAKSWKILEGYPKYKISRDGRVYSILYKRVMSGSTKPDGRRYITLYNKEHVLKTVPIHRLVAMAYIKGRSKENDIVNHIDGDPSNNNANNLEWCTASHNTLHAIMLGLIKVRK